MSSIDRRRQRTLEPPSSGVLGRRGPRPRIIWTPDRIRVEERIGTSINPIATVQTDDPVDRFALYLTQMEPGENASPPPWNLRIGAGLCGALEVIYSGTVTPNTFDQTGLLVQISGLLAQEFAIWADITAPAALPFTAWTMALLDFSGAPCKPGDNLPLASLNITRGSLIP